MTLDIDQQEKYIAIWAKVVDTQMHFNEMCVNRPRLLTACAIGEYIAVGCKTFGRWHQISAMNRISMIQIGYRN